MQNQRFARNVWNFNCRICGFNNKLFRVIINKDKKIIGYSLKCCQCGHIHEFHLDYEDNGIYNLLTSMLYYHKGLDVCLQPTYCEHKECPLYGTCKYNEKDNIDKNIITNQHKCNENHDNILIDIQVNKQPKYL